MREDRRERWEKHRREVEVLPSLLSADFGRLAEEISAVEEAGASILHLDVMDGHFVPNITFGPPVVAAIRRHTHLWLDAHLMVTDPLAFLEPFARAGADGITIHMEVGTDVSRCRKLADELGVRLGLAIRPDSPIAETLERSGDLFDLVLVMTVMPGFGGQRYLDGSRERIETAADYCRRSARSPVLEVDGGIGPGTAADAARAGARWLVAGNAVFRNPHPGQAFRALLSEARAAALSADHR